MRHGLDDQKSRVNMLANEPRPCPMIGDVFGRGGDMVERGGNAVRRGGSQFRLREAWQDLSLGHTFCGRRSRGYEWRDKVKTAMKMTMYPKARWCIPFSTGLR